MRWRRRTFAEWRHTHSSERSDTVIQRATHLLRYTFRRKTREVRRTCSQSHAPSLGYDNTAPHTDTTDVFCASAGHMA